MHFLLTSSLLLSVIPMENLAINKEPTLQIMLALLPGVIASILLHNHHYLLASFYAVCAIIPFGIAHTSKPITYAFSMVLMLCSLIACALINHWFLLFLFLAGPTTLFSIYEKEDKSLKTMTSWWIIGVVYGGFHIHQTTELLWPEYVLIFLLTLLGCFIALYSKKSMTWERPAFTIHKKYLRYYIKYATALFITITILASLHLEEGEWLIWSCFSVLSLDFSKAKTKYQQRLVGVAFGVGLGLLMTKIMPPLPWLEYVYIVCILLSLRLFHSYLYSFATRCFFVVLYAGSNYQEIGHARLTDIALGGAIGILISYALRNRDISNANRP
ncbi:FUSC family protein [Legionella nagasakiensis]|uniref:FUSC family protein n=1 Tax=Legionella nagasakiensis TaxID=535290 RepID=UPI001056987F|nr:FUSC family protein [Legionella nagasakiensis]